MGHRIRRGEAGHLRHRRARTQDEEHAFAEDPSAAAIVESDLDGSWSDEPAVAHDQFHSARHRARDVRLMQPVDHEALTALDVLHADGERIRLEAEFRATPRQRYHPCRMDQVLAGQARDVRAGPAEPPPFDHRGPMARLGHRPGEVLPRLSAPQNEDLELFNVRHWAGPMTQEFWNA